MGKIFKASLIDGPRRIMHDTEQAQRTAVAHFPGANVRARRDGVDEDETLKIYREVMKNGLPTEEHLGHFIGRAFSGEADPKGLTVFHYGGGGGGIPTGAIGDQRSRGPMTAARLQAQIVAGREKNAAADALVALEKAGRR
jgi:hypothetical protein